MFSDDVSCYCSHLHPRASSEFFRPFFQIAASGTTLLNGSQLLILLHIFESFCQLRSSSLPIFYFLSLAAFSQNVIFVEDFCTTQLTASARSSTQLRLGGKASRSNPSLRSNSTGKGLLLHKGVRVDLSCVACIPSVETPSPQWIDMLVDIKLKSVE